MNKIKFMRLLVMFDLPVKTKRDRYNAGHFRKYLLKHGYLMLQYSVYYRIVKGFDMARSYERQLKEHVPNKGSVLLLVITERQFNHIHILVGKQPENDKKVNMNNMSTF